MAHWHVITMSATPTGALVPDYSDEQHATRADAREGVAALLSRLVEQGGWREAAEPLRVWQASEVLTYVAIPSGVVFAVFECEDSCQATAARFAAEFLDEVRSLSPPSDS